MELAWSDSSEKFLMPRNGSVEEAKDNVDNAAAAILRHADRFWPCPTLEDVAAWHVLPIEMRDSASIELDGGAVYLGREIEKLQRKH